MESNKELILRWIEQEKGRGLLGLHAWFVGAKALVHKDELVEELFDMITAPDVDWREYL